MDKYVREPMSAAVIAAAITAAYVLGKSKMNGEKKVKNSDMMKPAFLVGLLVYFIVSQGIGQGDAMTNEPY
jgi:ABC-type tungstate transport system substrate-binding protein